MKDIGKIYMAQEPDNANLRTLSGPEGSSNKQNFVCVQEFLSLINIECDQEFWQKP